LGDRARNTSRGGYAEALELSYSNLQYRFRIDGDGKFVNNADKPSRMENGKESCRKLEQTILIDNAVFSGEYAMSQTTVLDMQSCIDQELKPFQRLDVLINQATVTGNRYSAATQSEINTEMF
jgi:hypothetical protein